MKISDDASRKDVFNFLAKASIYGNLGLFAGAGLSKAVVNDTENELALSWGQLIDKCAIRLKIDIEDLKFEGQSYPELASALVRRLSQKKSISRKSAEDELKKKIVSLTCWFPNDFQRELYGTFLSTISPNWIITTNYDLILECLLTGKSISLGPNEQLIAPKGIIPIYHLHGVRTFHPSIIITQEDYVTLFRPNDYRHTKLPLTIKESTTLIMGYGLGDVNVLTAVDWSKNVFTNQDDNYNHDLIQVIRTKNYKKNPYRNDSEIMIIETDDYSNFFEELCEVIKLKRKEEELLQASLIEINERFNNPTNERIENFIENDKFRKETLQLLSRYEFYVISGFVELHTKCIEKLWRDAEPRGAFEPYNKLLKLYLDILIELPITKIPPAILNTVAYDLNQLLPYVGTSFGCSFTANATWVEKKGSLPSDTINEMLDIAKTYRYYKLQEFFDKI